MIRVLVAEDHAIVREGIKQLIGMARDLEVVGEASNGEQLLETLRKVECDVVLLDISMPGKTGLSLLDTLSKSYPDMAIIMVSGNDDLETATFAMRQGADDYLAKPVHISLLVYRIEKALLRRALVLENKAYREHLEHLVTELNLRLEQNRGVLTSLNSLVQSLMRREEETPQAFAGLQQAVSDIDSGLESLAEFSKGIINEAPAARRPD